MRATAKAQRWERRADDAPRRCLSGIGYALGESEDCEVAAVFGRPYSTIQTALTRRTIPMRSRRD